MKHSLLALGLIFLPILALAEDNTVVVTASRYEQPITNTLNAVTVLTEEDIKRYGDNNLASLLTRIAGITQTPTGSLGTADSIQMRGLSTSQMIVLIDGVRAGSATLGGATLNGIALSNIERIEIVRGPASSLYGADGIGGIIQIFTRSPQQREDDINLSAEYGSYNYRNLNAGFNVSAGKTSASGHIGYLATDGFDSTTLNTNGNEDKDGFQQWSGSLSTDTQLTDNLSFGLSHSQALGVVEFDENGCTTNCTDIQSTTNLMNSQLHIDLALNNNWALSSQVGRHLDDLETESGSPGVHTTERLTYNLSATGKPSSGINATIGTDGYKDSVDSTTAYEETERTNVALYGQSQLSTANYSVQASLRVDDNSAYGTNLTGSAAASVVIVDDLEAILSYGTAFKAPTFNDLYWPGFGNPDLKPEESETVEFTLRQFFQNGHWRVSAYHSKVEDLIQSGNNLDSTLSGIEGEWSQQLGLYDIELAAAYLNARDADDNQLENRPEWSGSAVFGRNFGQFGLNVNALAEQGRISGGEDIDGFVLLGLGGDYSLENNSRLYARLDNLFDQDYVLNHSSFGNYDYNTPGRTFKVGIEYHL